ncbi:PREDICTED: hunchback-like protein [Branchiostoma belcheri]|uniref:Hunchback-like protein n=1 Tax=Branchiostoma belcheri TaxID=7741 RepID=A0A6P4ZTY9_BRABE|nr:PREDICTED: hunchback-like protein [Branchiostoma belcheri]
MARIKENPCGLSQEVTLAVLPRLYMEEVVTELRRRNISPDTNTAGNCREHLLRILQDVIEQEYRGAVTGASSDLGSSLDVLHLPQGETIAGSNSQNSTTVRVPPKSSQVPPRNIQACNLFELQTIPVSNVQNSTTVSLPVTRNIQATLPDPCSLMEFQTIPVSNVQNSRTISLPITSSQVPTSSTQATSSDPCSLFELQTVPVANVQVSTTLSLPVTSSQILEGTSSNSSHIQFTSSDACSLLELQSIPVSTVQDNVTTSSVPVDTLQNLSTLSAACSTFEDADVTVEFAIEEVDHTQYTMESCSSDDDDGMAATDVPVTVTVDENFSWSILSKDDETAKRNNERNASQDDETSVQNNSKSKKESVSQDRAKKTSKKKASKTSSKTKRSSTGDKVFKCGECSYSISRKRDLALHKMKHHTGEMPFKCKDCNYSTARKTDLKKHRIVHTRTLPFSCELCDFKTAYQSCLSRHMKVHDENSEEAKRKDNRVYKCGECDFSTKKRENLHGINKITQAKCPTRATSVTTVR